MRMPARTAQTHVPAANRRQETLEARRRRLAPLPPYQPSPAQNATRPFPIPPPICLCREYTLRSPLVAPLPTARTLAWREPQVPRFRQLAQLQSEQPHLEPL